MMENVAGMNIRFVVDPLCPPDSIYIMDTCFIAPTTAAKDEYLKKLRENPEELGKHIAMIKGIVTDD